MMRLSDHQWAFLKDLAVLIAYADSQGWKLTGGELHRTVEQQEIYFRSGKSKTRDSWHLRRLAQDLFLFINGQLTWKWADYKRLGDFWENLSPFNRWGGNFKSFVDAVHFERRTKPREGWKE